MKKRVFLILGVSFLCSLGQTVSGQSINVPDNSFEGITASVESPAGGGVETGSIGSWDVSATGLLGLPTSVESGDSFGGPTPIDGTFSARFTLPLTAGAGISIDQTLPESFLANSRYELSLDIDVGTSIGLLNGASLQLRSGTTPVASLTGVDLVSLIDTSSGFQQVSLTYNTSSTPPSENINLYFGAASSASVAGDIYFDDFQLTVTPVPEPGTIVLIVIGGVFLFALRRGRSKVRCA